MSRINKIAAVPKGFLRYYILKLLAKKPMSGSEIVQAIITRTEGLWKPSPGSIYPLLSRLKDKGYIEETKEEKEEGEMGLKRYMLTEKGRALLQEMIRNREDTRKKEAYLLPLFVGPFESDTHPQEILELNKVMRDLLINYWNLLDVLRERYSSNVVKEIISVVTRTSQLIRKIIKKLEHEM